VVSSARVHHSMTQQLSDPAMTWINVSRAGAPYEVALTGEKELMQCG
jgi:hypothetical protein